MSPIIQTIINTIAPTLIGWILGVGIVLAVLLPLNYRREKQKNKQCRTYLLDQINKLDD